MKRFFSLIKSSLPRNSCYLTAKFPNKLLLARTFTKDSDATAIKRVLANATPSEGPKLLIGFTCKSCTTRTHRLMSRHAYEKGIVLIECPGCQTRHLIADNLGWFRDTPQAARRIEDMPEVGLIKRELNLTESEASELLEVLTDGKDDESVAEKEKKGLK